MNMHLASPSMGQPALPYRHDPAAIARALGGTLNGQGSITCPGPGKPKSDASLVVVIGQTDAFEDGFAVMSRGGQDARECREYVKRKAFPDRAQSQDHQAQHDHTPAEKSSRTNFSQPLTAESLSNMAFEPVRWAVPDLLPEGLTLFAGRPKIGKSWFVLSLALSVARGGRTFLGTEVTEEAAGDVLYAACEDSPRRLQDRLDKLDPDRSFWPRGLQFLTELPTLNEGGIDRVRYWLENEAKNPKLVIIDTLAAVRSPRKAGQNEFQGDYEAIVALQKLATEFRVAIVIVHHTRKSESADPFDAISGTLGLNGAADALFVLNRNASGGVSLYGRGRELPEFEKPVRFDQDSCEWEPCEHGEGTPGKPEKQQSAARAAILAVLTEAAGEPLSAAEVSTLIGKPRNNVYQYLFQMKNAGQIAKKGSKYVAPEYASALGN